MVCLQVLEELGDIIDLPMRAEAVDALLAVGDSGLVAAFEGLTVLEGTANNIKEAWRRWGCCRGQQEWPCCLLGSCVCAQKLRLRGCFVGGAANNIKALGAGGGWVRTQGRVDSATAKYGHHVLRRWVWLASRQVHAYDCKLFAAMLCCAGMPRRAATWVSCQHTSHRYVGRSIPCLCM